ncbi:hypothetical protein SARC_06469 [Sphaeroforma arctica JP610]|uniref:Phosphoglycerate mutase n=1 Tax=Sphaeroforma arctica JP610 TaxID=667725 RepID=A0A0L0FXB0_9EUKA|nr:hypothetical protein SARC_06469 [Sphaeroforma arctica JP610]KNC81186.1 hypothetical protein SARC_06469 [Sphaeroforma arctica JP610]|eukprot:XP_014155088.1 hypothetical protein SARC_06469 [Sphaeroforma arctica JP610]
MSKNIIQGRQVWFVRHGQSESQYQSKIAADSALPNVVIADPDLSVMGRQQSDDLKRYILLLKAETGRKVDLVVSSPLTRALSTATRALSRVENGTSPVKVLASIRERSNRACDCGSSTDELRQSFPAIDMRELPEDWWQCWHGDFQESVESVAKRAEEFTEWLRGRPEKTIAVFSHGNFLLHQLGGPRMGNCELRLWNIDIDADSKTADHPGMKLNYEVKFQSNIGKGFETKSS